MPLKKKSCLTVASPAMVPCRRYLHSSLLDGAPIFSFSIF